MINDKMKIIAEQQSQRMVLKGNTIKDGNTIYSVKSPFTFKGRNLINYKTTYDNTCFELVGNVLKNIVADQRQNDKISFSIYSWSYGSAGSKNTERNGRIAIELHPTQSGEYNFYHSGSNTNIYITKFNLIGGETYTLSLDVISHDSRVVGGFEIANIQLEKGNQATPYLAYDNQLVYIRTKRVDLGTLTWSYNASVGHERFQSGGINTLIKKPSAGNIKANIICSKFKTVTDDDIYLHREDKTIGVYTNGNLEIYDSNYTDATEFKASLSGVILEYETAEPLELNGIGTNYDTFENHSGKVVRKIRKVKLKDLTYTKSSTNFLITKPTDFNDNTSTKLVCSKYEVDYPESILVIKDKAISAVVALTGKVNLILKDTDYSNVTALKNSFTDNDYLYYELNAPTTETERSVLIDHRYNKVVDSNGNEIDTD